MNQKQTKQKHVNKHFPLNISDYVYYLTKNTNGIYKCPCIPNSRWLSDYLELRVCVNQITSDEHTPVGYYK